MKFGNAVDSLSNALVMALQADLEPIEGQRPLEDDCYIFHFEQDWESTALGFGGLGGQAITSAWTTVVIGPCCDACVYFAGRLAYKIASPSGQFFDDVSGHKVARRGEHHKYNRQP